MSLIKVKFDHKLEQSDIIIPLNNSSVDEMGEYYTNNLPNIQQTLVYGILSPLIMINNIVIDIIDIIDFELTCTSITPTLRIIVKDRYKLITTLDTPGVDNELRLQILPRFDDKYKKINLTFFISSMNINNDYITLRAEYKSPKLSSSNLKSFGEISTYNLFENIAIETGMGFASNVDNNDNDKRYIYCDNKTYIDLLNSEIRRSGYDMTIYDYWVDWWNNIILADIYERYNAVDSDQDMQVWISGQNKEITEGSEIEPQQAVATLTNNPAFRFTELYAKQYHITNKPGSHMWLGTDQVYSVYEDTKGEYMDYLIQDGDVKKDIFTKFDYLGETYGEYNYLLSNKKRDTFLQKIKTNETLEIITGSPLLGLMRGNHVNLMWYINDSAYENMRDRLKEEGCIQEDGTNIPLTSADDIDYAQSDNRFILDKSISGQYLITGCRIVYNNKEWKYHLYVSRPSSVKPKILKSDE